jgi:hypothetical protein
MIEGGTMEKAKFILWDPKDGEPRTDEAGVITSDGIIGRVGRDNVYVRTYPVYDDVERDIEGNVSLEVGGFAVATFNLSGSKGRYRVYRVQ